MTEQLVTTTPAVIEQTFLVARTSGEMRHAQGALQEWLTSKAASEESELEELDGMLRYAKAHKWRTNTLRARVKRQKQRVVFYEKCAAAVAAGYCVIPDFPIDLFAIRVKKELPTAPANQSTYEHDARVADEKPQLLPAGEGRYVSPEQAVMNSSYPTERDGKKTTMYMQEAIAFENPELPMKVATPAIMTAATEAMALKLFDEIGICPGTGRGRRRADPLVIARVLEGNHYNAKSMSFVIGWCVDVRGL
jgi:hypothetical protein